MTVEMIMEEGALKDIHQVGKVRLLYSSDSHENMLKSAGAHETQRR